MTNIKKILSNELETTLTFFLRGREVGFVNNRIQFGSDAPNYKIEGVKFQWDTRVQYIENNNGLDFDVKYFPSYRIILELAGLEVRSLKQTKEITLDEIIGLT